MNQQEREAKERMYEAISLFIHVPRELLDQIVQRYMDSVPSEEKDDFVSMIVASQCQMHNLMKETVHQVHGLLAEHPARWKSRTLGYDLHKIAALVLVTNDTLFGLVEDDTLNMLALCEAILQVAYNKQASNAITTGNEEES
jgi:hypothetical protein